MSRKRDAQSSGFEDVENTIQDDLYDTLYRTGNSSHFNKAWDIFNKPFQIQSVIVGFQSRLPDLLEVFSDAINFGCIDHFVHFDDVIEVSGVSRSSAMRRYHSLGDEMKRSFGDCKYHPGGQCTMIEQDVGFLLYLTWLDIPNPVEEKNEDPEGDFEPRALMDVDDEENIPPSYEECALMEKFTQLFLGQIQ